MAAGPAARQPGLGAEGRQRGHHGRGEYRGAAGGRPKILAGKGPRRGDNIIIYLIIMILYM